MVDIDDDMDDEEYEEQVEQMIVENGMLLHAAINVLVKKGIIKQNEIDEELERLYEEAEDLEEEEEDDE